MAPLGVSRLYAAAALLLSPLAVLAQVYPPTPQQQADAAAIIAAAFSPANNASAWTRLAYITDTFGPRMSGSPALSAVIDYIAATAASVDGLKVTLEPVQAPHWVRGVEWAQLESPRAKRLHACGAGYSNSSGSPPAPITADVIVVGSQAELISRAAEAVGKIVLFDWPTWQGYGTTVEFRYNAASWTAAVGGVGALFKSVTYWGLQTCHTGVSEPAAVPAMAVSHEDSLQMRRMIERGQAVRVTMYMEAALLAPVTQYNVILDYAPPGASDELVIVSGHLDSWDIAEGAMDDGGGMISAWEAVRLIASLGLKSARTIRAILWLDEESGGAGAAQYAIDYASTFPTTSFAMESDTGAFGIYGLSVTANATALAQLQALAPLFTPLGSAQAVVAGGDDTDEAYLVNAGVPGGALWPYDPRTGWKAPLTGEDPVNNPCAPLSSGVAVPPTMPFSVSSGYMLYHHTEADTVDKMDPTQLQTVSATNAIWALSVANLPGLLPRA